LRMLWSYAYNIKPLSTNLLFMVNTLTK
jgi:hypothetical protein